jgi:CubicO group peptidase (beta-lactamase class C family)
VAAYWPELAQAGKDDITVRQLLAHQAGLFAFDERVDGGVVADLDRLAGVMERQRPIWPPGERQAYHAITLGFYENELVRRIDPDHRTIGQLLHEDIAAPLGVGDEVYIGTPSSLPDQRLAALVPPAMWTRLTSMPVRLTIDAMRPRSVLHRSLVANPGTSFYVDPRHVIVREVEVPSGGVVRVVDPSGATLLEQPVSQGDIFRVCRTTDVAVRVRALLTAPPAGARWRAALLAGLVLAGATATLVAGGGTEHLFDVATRGASP